VKDILNKIPVIHLRPVLGDRSDFSPEDWQLILNIRAAVSKRRTEDFLAAKQDNP